MITASISETQKLWFQKLTTCPPLPPPHTATTQRASKARITQGHGMWVEPETGPPRDFSLVYLSWLNPLLSRSIPEVALRSSWHIAVRRVGWGKGKGWRRENGGEGVGDALPDTITSLSPAQESGRTHGSLAWWETGKKSGREHPLARLFQPLSASPLYLLERLAGCYLGDSPSPQRSSEEAHVSLPFP